MKRTQSFRRTHIGDKKLRRATQMMTYGYSPALSEGAVKPPVFLTSTFVFNSAEEGEEFFHIASGRKPAPEGEGVGGLVYSRLNHPNIEIVEDRLAISDNAESALLTASGMAAISAVLLTFLRPGDGIVHYSPLYGGTEGVLGQVLPSWMIHSEPYTDGLSETALIDTLNKAAAHGPVKMVYIETPANPTNAIVDMEMTRRVVDAWTGDADRPLIVCDNTLLGPVFQNPLAHGVDLCVYSLTKYVGGHSDLVAGGITGSHELIHPIRMTRSAFGFQLDPHSSWMLSRSMETLDLRMQHAANSGRAVAAWLADNKLIPCQVLHPEHISDPTYQAAYKRHCLGPGSTFSFVVENDRDLAFHIINELQLFKLAVSLGGTESLVCHPASTTHSGMTPEAREAAGISEGLIRLSVGLEHPDDLIADLEMAFNHARKS